MTQVTWKPEVHVEGKWSANALVFETKKEAADYAYDLYVRWMSTTDHRAVASDDPANYRYVDRRLVAIIIVEGSKE